MESKFTILTVILFLSVGVFAQETITTAGGEATGGGNVSYTVGQVVYTTNTGTNGSVAKGVQQPYEISIITATNEVNNISINLVAYPNPLVNELTLNIDDAAFLNKDKLSYQMYDVSGKLLMKGDINQKNTKINVENLPKATYFIKVFNTTTILKTIRIIKH